MESIWEEEDMPEDSHRDALIVAIYKNIGSNAECGNYSCISLLSIAGIVLNRLITVSERNLPVFIDQIKDFDTVYRGPLDDPWSMWLPGKVCKDDPAIPRRYGRTCFFRW